MKRSALVPLLGFALLAGGTASSAEHLRADRSFVISLRAPAGVATSAFGPVEERGWSPEWNPDFVYPHQPKSVEGAVFTVGSGPERSTWLLETFDPRRHLVRYVTVGPDVLTRVTLRVEAAGASRSRATITFARTALSDDGDVAVAHFARHFTGQAPHWQAALNAYFAAMGSR
jgi:hypothetical protein